MKVEVGLWWVGFFDEEKDVQAFPSLRRQSAGAAAAGTQRGPFASPAGSTRSHGMHARSSNWDFKTGIPDLDS